jgi:nitronate monooxygenase
MSDHQAITRAKAFCETFNIRVPVLMAPMAGASPASLATAVANAGGLGACGALLMQPDASKLGRRTCARVAKGGLSDQPLDS